MWLPSDKDKKARWLNAIPKDNTSDSKNTVMCERHWPQEYLILRQTKDL